MFVTSRCYARRFNGGDKSCLLPASSTHDDSIEAPSHACYRQMLHTVAPVEASIHACYCWIKDGATVMMRWSETSSSFEVSGSRQEMMVEVVSSTSMHTLVGTGNKRSSIRLCRHAIAACPC
jgi:hypothetical protein